MLKWLLTIVGGVIAAVVAGVVLLLLNGNGGETPSVTNIDTEIVNIGQQVNISVKNVHSISALFLVQGDNRISVPFETADESTVIARIPGAVEPGEYNLEFKTASGDTISTEQKLEVSAPQLVADPTPTPEPTIRVDLTGPPDPTIQISPTPALVVAGGTLQLIAKMVDTSGRVVVGRTVMWSSDDPSVATVNSATGLVRGVSPGTTEIMASSEDLRQAVTLTVERKIGRFKLFLSGDPLDSETFKAERILTRGVPWATLTTELFGERDVPVRLEKGTVDREGRREIQIVAEDARTLPYIPASVSGTDFIFSVCVAGSGQSRDPLGAFVRSIEEHIFLEIGVRFAYAPHPSACRSAQIAEVIVLEVTWIQ